MLSDPREIAVIYPITLGVMSLISGITIRRKSRKTSNGRIPLRRLPGKVGLQMMFLQLSVIFLLVVFFSDGILTQESIGISDSFHAIPALAIGIAVGLILVQSFDRLAVWMGISDTFRDFAVAVIARLIPRSKPQKILTYIGLAVLNPFTEEMLFRGVLIHHWHFIGQSLALAIGVGLLITLGNHLYQGLLPQIFHLLFFMVATALLFSPVGLMGAIGCHIVGDVFPLLKAKSELKRYRLRHSRYRSSKNRGQE